MDLYTSQVRLKQALNGGELVPMTPVTGAALNLIDPQFTIGLGALTEHPALGLRCPVRGCGKHFHALTYHLNRSHRGVGGASAVKRALSIPSTARLVSAAVRTSMSERATRRWAEGGGIPQARLVTPDRSAYRRAARSISENKVSMGARNIRDRCNAQLTHKLIDLEHTLGRSPTKDEAIELLGRPVVAACEQVFGSWANAKGQCGLQVYKGGANEQRIIRREAVLVALRAWYVEHGSLPSCKDAEGRTNRSPYIPSVRVVLREMDTTSWPTAMERAAALLNIYGGRYGLPESVRPRKAS